MKFLAVVAQAAVLTHHGDDQLGASGVVSLDLLAQLGAVAVVGGEEQVVGIGHCHLAGLVLGTVGAVESGDHSLGLQILVLAFHLAPQVADDHIVGADEVHVLFRQGVGFQNTFLIVAEDTFAVNELHLGNGGLAGLHMQMGGVHALGCDGIQHDLAVDIVAHRADIGGIAAQTQGVNSHVHRTAAGIGLAAVNVVVKVNAVRTHCCQFHSGFLLSDPLCACAECWKNVPCQAGPRS